MQRLYRFILALNHWISANPYTPFILATICFVSSAIWLYSSGILLAPPSGLHFIRQTDSVAFIEYYRLGFGDLFHPGVLDFNSAPAGGRTASEFPLLHWLIAKCDLDNWVLRLAHLGILILGHVSFAVSATRVSGQFVLGLAASACLWGSSVVAYYGCNYLVDPAAYGLCLIGWAAVLPSLVRGQTDLPWSALFCLSLAGLLKATAAMHLLAIGLTTIACSYSKDGHHSRERLMNATKLAVGLLPVVLWHGWVIHYNETHGASYFLTSATPIWTMSSVQISTTLDLIWRHWWTDYLHPSVWHALAVLSIILVARAKTLRSSMLVSIALLFGACLSYAALFFQKFNDHDYYIFPVFPMIGLLLLFGVHALWESSHLKLIRAACLIGFSGLALASIVLGKEDLDRRTSASPDQYSIAGVILSDYSAANVDLPIKARVIVLGDNTPHGGLTTLGRQGWSFPGYPVPMEPDFSQLLKAGATHILVLQQQRLPALDLIPIVRTDGYQLFAINQ